MFGNESCQVIRAVPPRAETSSSGIAALARCCVSYIIFGVFFQQLKHAPIWLISIMDAALKIIIGLFAIRPLVVELLARARKGRACAHARNGANSLGGMSQD